jgi:hypothetical protein
MNSVQPSRSPSAASSKGLQLIGVLLIGVGALALHLASVQEVSLLSLVGMLAAGLVGSVGLILLQKGRKRQAMTAEAVMADDSRRPVVYLREFAEDERAAATFGIWLSFQTRTEEEQLAHVVTEIGPFVAIGDPRETLPDLGAARLYVPDEQWRERVLNLIRRASLVVLRAGTTQAFLWELSAAVEHCPPQRVVILVASPREHYERFRAQSDPLMRKPLPAYSPSGVRLGALVGIVRFEKDWTAVFEPLKRSGGFPDSFQFPLADSLRVSLRPVLERLGARYRPMRD